MESKAGSIALPFIYKKAGIKPAFFCSAPVDQDQARDLNPHRAGLSPSPT